MKFFALILAVGSLALNGAMAFVKSDGIYNAASATSITVNLATVTAGNLIFVSCKTEGAASTMTASDGSSTFTQSPTGVTSHANNDLQTSTFSAFSSSASGTVTYTCAYGGASKAFRSIIVMEFSVDSGETRSLDGNNGNSGTGTSLTSGVITTTGTDVVVVGTYANYSGTGSISEQIGGTNADGEQVGTGGAANMWYRILTSAMVAGQATATVANEWASQILAVKSVASGGASQPRRGFIIK